MRGIRSVPSAFEAIRTFLRKLPRAISIKLISKSSDANRSALSSNPTSVAAKRWNISRSVRIVRHTIGSMNQIVSFRWTGPYHIRSRCTFRFSCETINLSFLSISGASRHLAFNCARDAFPLTTGTDLFL